MPETKDIFIGMTVANVVILILNTIGNFLVIQAIVRTNRLRTASNFLVANLAFCDLMSPLLNIPIDISVEVSSLAWHYGPVVCRIIWPVATMMTTSSALTLVAISIDRSRALRHPFVTKLTLYQAVGTVLFIHVVSLLLIIPYSIASVIIDGQCAEDWNASIFTSRQYTLIIFHVQYLMPLIVLALVYSCAARYLRRSTLSLIKLEECTDSSVEQSETKSLRRRRSNAPNSPRRQASLTIRREQNTRVMKMFAVVVTVFAFLTLPNNVRWMVDDFANHTQYAHKNLVSFLCTMCTYFNCFANPIIYGTFSRDYKVSFLRVLTLGRYGNAYESKPRRTGLSRLPSSFRRRRSLNNFRDDMNRREVTGTMV
ncbi:neuropeptide FF receptor 1-like [Dendronephthya gigantea]|uniref:neuropeptide FF receptor 1-like n=1 Tax=Dendronephthya gigantea TaxID=151771 RepID=UPI00106C630D|nr:neuropeptide FF receptor 1-like [Dendronephthya gigantea]